MSPTFALLLTLAVSQADADWRLAARPARGLELVYRGRYEEQDAGTPPQRRGYDIEARTFVLDVSPRGADVAFLTVLRAAGASATAPGSARLALATIDSHGRVTPRGTGGPPAVPLDGPPSLDPIGFVELPAGAVRVGSGWDVADGPRPPCGWRVEGATFRGGVRALKVVGEQHSAEWERPTGGRPGSAGYPAGWRRVTTVWLDAQAGTVLRLERAVESRTGVRSTTTYELDNAVTCPDQLAADRRREILQAAQFAEALAALAARPGRIDAVRYQAIADQIDRHLRAVSPTPYRPAVLAAKERAEAGLRGEVPPPADAPDPPAAPPAVGRLAPDFVTTDLVTGAPVRPARWRGRPAVLLFVRPDAPAAAAVLRLAQEFQARYRDRLRVAVLVVSDEDRARPAWVEAGVPLLAGRDAAVAYAVGGAALVVAVDADGVVRYLGANGPAAVAIVEGLIAR